MVLNIFNYFDKITNGKLKFTIDSFEAHVNQVFSLASLDNGYLASGSRDTTVKIWDIGTSI